MAIEYSKRVPIDYVTALAGFALAYLILERLTGSGIANSMTSMMGQRPASDWTAIAVNLAVSFFVAVAVFFIVQRIELRPQMEKTPKTNTPRELRQKALNVIQRGLSKDAKAALKEIQRTGSITQDSVRMRLGWSKAKTSTILTNLDKLNLIQRERMGKTYRVFISRSFKN